MDRFAKPGSRLIRLESMLNRGIDRGTAHRTVMVHVHVARAARILRDFLWRQPYRSSRGVSRGVSRAVVSTPRGEGGRGAVAACSYHQP
jgi:hypothetical protein